MALPDRGVEKSKNSGKMPPCCLETYTRNRCHGRWRRRGCIGGLGDGLVRDPAVGGQRGVHPRGPLGPQEGCQELECWVQSGSVYMTQKGRTEGVMRSWASSPDHSLPVSAVTPGSPQPTLLPRELSLGLGALVQMLRQGQRAVPALALPGENPRQ